VKVFKGVLVSGAHIEIGFPDDCAVWVDTGADKTVRVLVLETNQGRLAAKDVDEIVRTAIDKTLVTDLNAPTAPE